MIHNITDRERELACVIADLKDENKLLREAALMGLEALESSSPFLKHYEDCVCCVCESITALKEALGEQG